VDLVTQQQFIMILLGLPCGIVAVTAGGGVTLGIPLLMLAGIAADSSVIAVKVALWAAFLTGSLTHARKLPEAAVAVPWWLWPMCLVGAILGSQLLTVIDPARLHGLVLALLIASIIGTVWATWSDKTVNAAPSRFQKVAGFLIVLVLAVYSGFFGAGYGVFLIWALVSLHGHSPSTAAALGTRLSLIISSASVAVFVVGGVIPWAITVPLALGCAIGGALGARAVTIFGDNLIRAAMWIVSILAAAKLLVP
jgi:uncharacterized protein